MATLTSSPFHPHMNPVLRRYLPYRHRSISCSTQQQTQTWTRTPLTRITPASRDLSHFSISLDVSSDDVISSFTSPGQYLQLRIPSSSSKPAFLAIASPPSLAESDGRIEFLVKRVVGSTADELCEMKEGDVVEITGVMGKGFGVEKISPPEEYGTVLIFATGSGISPIRSLIEFGFGANERSDVRLYYGARNLDRMAYQDRFKAWEASGVKIVPVLSQPDDTWKGERGYIQTVYSKAKQILDPASTGAVLCGHKGMTEDVTSVLVADGVSQDKILMNF